jgi:hypothetical protein
MVFIESIELIKSDTKRERYKITIFMDFILYTHKLTCLSGSRTSLGRIMTAR